MRSSVYKGSIIAILCCVILMPFGVSAATPVVYPFGGRMVNMTVCTCSGNLLLYVQDVRGFVLPLLYQPGATLLYKWYRPTSGVWGLGNFVGGGVCTIYAGTGCVPGGYPIGTMTQLGTSVDYNSAVPVSGN